MLLLACVWYKYLPLLLLPDASYTGPRPHTPPPPFLVLVLFFSFLHLSFSFPASFPCLGVQGGHAEDLAPALAAELGGDNAVDAGADGVAGLVDEDAGVVVEAHDAAVGALQLLGRPHHNGVPYVAAAHLVGRAHRHAAAAGLGPEAALLLHNDDDAFAWEGGLARGCLVGRLLEFVEPGGAFEVCAVLAGMTGSSKLCFKDFKACM